MGRWQENHFGRRTRNRKFRTSLEKVTKLNGNSKEQRKVWPHFVSAGVFGALAADALAFGAGTFAELAVFGGLAYAFLLRGQVNAGVNKYEKIVRMDLSQDGQTVSINTVSSNGVHAVYDVQTAFLCAFIKGRLQSRTSQSPKSISREHLLPPGSPWTRLSSPDTSMRLFAFVFTFSLSQTGELPFWVATFSWMSMEEACCSRLTLLETKWPWSLCWVAEASLISPLSKAHRNHDFNLRKLLKDVPIPHWTTQRSLPHESLIQNKDPLLFLDY